jgi:ribose 5-phosphate isomerase B
VKERIAIGADHRGFELKKLMTNQLSQYIWIDHGCFNSKTVDYPIIAKKVCNSIVENKTKLGILICGSGIGMSIAANRHRKIYAALCWNESIAKISREHDGSNILVLSSDFISQEESIIIFRSWISAKFNDGKYQDRLSIIDPD